MRKEYVATGKTLDEAIANVCALANTTIDKLDDWDVLEAGKSGFLGIGRRDFKVAAYVEEPDKPEKEEKTSTFGKKKTKREKFDEKAAKEAKKTKDIEIRPIVTAEPDPERAAAREEERRERRNRRDRKPRVERGERPERAEREAKAAKPAAAPKAALEKRRESHAVNITEGEMADRLYADARAFLDPIFAKLGVAPEITPEVKEGILWLTVRGDDLGILIGRRGETLNSLQYLVNLAVNKRRHEHARLVLDVEGYREGREETLTALARKMAEKAVRSGRRVELEPMNPHERRVVHIALQEDKRVDTVSHGEEPYRRVVINPKNRKNRKGRGNKEGRNDNLAAEAEATLVMPAETAPETVTSVPAPPQGPAAETSSSDLSARIAAEVAALQAKAAEKPDAE
ncbi:MAG: KH domain-containing protein [Firmicutes bacterium]|nr:KH domain-containing protein [Bacillota bacterium]